MRDVFWWRVVAILLGVAFLLWGVLTVMECRPLWLAVVFAVPFFVLGEVMAVWLWREVGKP